MTHPDKRAPGQRVLHAGYVKALRAVVDGGASWHKVAEAVGINRTSAQRIVSAFARFGIAHIGRYEQHAHGNGYRWTPIYAFGEGEAPPWPGSGAARFGRTGRPPVELLTFCSAVQALIDEQQTVKSLVESSGMSSRTASRLIAALRGARLCFVEAYMLRDNGGLGHPLHRFGIDRADKPKRKPASPRELWTRQNAIVKRRRAEARLLRAMVTGSVRRSPRVELASEAP